MKKYVFSFGDGKADGKADMKNLLGGKGANLAEMTNLGIPVPAGFTLSTEVCSHFYEHEKNYPTELEQQVLNAIKNVENGMGKQFNDIQNPLLLSVRSGAAVSMPGMMETVLNVGLTSKTIPVLIEKTNNPRFVYDAYRRLIMMYSDVVMEKAAGVEPKDGIGIRERLEELIEERKKLKGVELDTELEGDDWKELSKTFKKTVKDVLGKEFPDDPFDQLWGGIGAVFLSWNGKRAISYRRIEGLPNEMGTAVNIQAMVFGNTGESSATGVAFTRNPATGENVFYGEWLSNAQGEDVVAGIRTPNPINVAGKSDKIQQLPSLEESMPTLYNQLDEIQKRLEAHYLDMQDIEFTIEDGKLWMLQTRVGKRNGVAAIKIAVDMLAEDTISKEETIMRVKPDHLDELLHPMVDASVEADTEILAHGLPAGPGGAFGQIVFTADDAESWAAKGKPVVLVRNETSPEDVHGMHAAAAILTAKGGMTSHAALVARGWGKCCIVGCSTLNINTHDRTLTVNNETLKEGDWITLNGTKGNVYIGEIPLVPADPLNNESFRRLMELTDEVRTLGIRTNAERPEDAEQARTFGAEGIGLCRTEHMFFDPERITAMREMIVAETEDARRKAVMKLLPFQRQDFYEILKTMEGLPVTIRLLDPPLHEFVTLTEEQISDLAVELGVDEQKLKTRINALHELNPMLGHRGCRLGIAYPEITEMQARAIFEATAKLTEEGVDTFPEVMIPLISTAEEFRHQEDIVRKIAKDVASETGIEFPYLVGTMIEIPRACLTANEVANSAEFFSFGTNDLTQTTYGFSRDDIGGFLPTYLEEKILSHDPFQSLDQTGVGQLVEMGVVKGRSIQPELKVGICGEHGGDPDSIDFFHRSGLNYVSCSPFRVPIARLAAAQAVLRNK
ncbi:MAG: pyruvate, phosphate dikinase [Candidatus Marinimicrobia bacterium]|jgi:pyruvate,orthophosphate dikinase|nr:pyruvate, phosphate dikinase [Candidatus Neomarinimicrobiota bacterium]|tara:strand:- start:4408 stop:7113 length:2706 start_codon:yes stop_codon:yes gene_type:complete